MLLYWIIDTHSERYSSIDAGQKLAYISDIGAQQLKPLFISGSAITTVTFNLSFLAERLLRHKGRLVPNQSRGERILFYLTIFFAFVGMTGLILLTILDTVQYPTAHDVFLGVFIAGYLLSAIFICWEYQRLGISMVPLETVTNKIYHVYLPTYVLTRSQKTVPTASCASHFGSNLPSYSLSLLLPLPLSV